ncbi:MAG: nucleoside triphosphate pyrophosphohydrolase [Bacteroidales bacterium]|jgi:XTP/dITP diphosphohydrolase|nr:nucleoside triphosphate pyrophosphohydrolase [Bacteroidales bacterium]
MTKDKDHTKHQPALESFGRLMDIMDELREKCPWDKKQTFESLRHLTIEETYELAGAILERNMDDIRKELGDILLHIVFYAKIASETGDFTIKEVIDGLCEKLIFRHPHVFGDVPVNDELEVKSNWENLKIKEGSRSILAGVPESLPAMVKALRIQDKVRAVGFDWDQREQVWDKVNEELDELKQEMERMDAGKAENELGDLLFSIINTARLYGFDPESALERTNRKFIKRFNYLEQKTIRAGRPLTAMSLDEMNVIWEEAKKNDDRSS